MSTLKPVVAVPATPAPMMIAMLRIQPAGALAKIPRDYLVSLELPFAAHNAAPGAALEVSTLARTSLSGLSSDASAMDRTTVREVTRPGKPRKDGPAQTVITAFEAELQTTGKPDADAVDRLRTAISDAGYRVTAQERRVCVEAGCMADAMVEWGASRQRPQAWYDEQTCGRHNYRGCTGCGSVFRLISEAASGPAPSLHCSVCGVVMVEWGGSKVWNAELIRSGRSPA